VELTKQSPYGFTTQIYNVEPGNEFEISAWYSGIPDKGVLVAADNTGKEFYRGQAKLTGKTENGWSFMQMTFVIDRLIQDKKLMIYLWNRGDSAVYFDDFRIIHKHNQEKNVKSILCSAEKRTADEKYFRSKSGIVLFEYGELQSNEHAFSGNFSAKTTKEHTYAMTVELPNFSVGDNYKVRVWTKSSGNNRHIVASSNNTQLFYAASDKVVNEEKGWQQIELEFTIPKIPGNELIKVYLWNSGSQVVYFDDFEITSVK
jgi:hypothetical protein